MRLNSIQYVAAIGFQQLNSCSAALFEACLLLDQAWPMKGSTGRGLDALAGNASAATPQVTPEGQVARGAHDCYLAEGGSQC